MDDDGRGNIPAPIVFVWDASGDALYVPDGCLLGLTMLDAAALEDATRDAVKRITEAARSAVAF